MQRANSRTYLEQICPGTSELWAPHGLCWNNLWEATRALQRVHQIHTGTHRPESRPQFDPDRNALWHKALALEACYM